MAGRKCWAGAALRAKGRRRRRRGWFPDFLSDFSALDWEWETGSGQEEQLIEEGETLRNRAGFVHFEQSIIKKVNSWPGIEMAKLK